MVKYITWKLKDKTAKNLKECINFRTKIVDMDELLECFEIKTANQEIGITIIDTSGRDGTRYIIMNNDNDVVIGMMSAVAKQQCEEEYHIDIEKLFFKKIRQELGFERKY